MPQPRARPGLPIVLGAVALCLVAAVALAISSQALDPETARRVFAETGPFESASPWLWATLGVLIGVVFRRPALGVLAGIALSLACAARELDLHKSITGYSVLKPGFYLSSEHALHHQIVAGAAVVALLAAALVLAGRVRALRPWRRLDAAWVWGFGFALLMFVTTKALDRAPSILHEDFGVVLSDRVRLLATALEEGLEMLVPVFFAAAVLAYAAATGSPRAERGAVPATV